MKKCRYPEICGVKNHRTGTVCLGEQQGSNSGSNSGSARAPIAPVMVSENEPMSNADHVPDFENWQTKEICTAIPIRNEDRSIAGWKTDVGEPTEMEVIGNYAIGQFRGDEGPEGEGFPALIEISTGRMVMSESSIAYKGGTMRGMAEHLNKFAPAGYGSKTLGVPTGTKKNEAAMKRAAKAYLRGDRDESDLNVPGKMVTSPLEMAVMKNDAVAYINKNLLNGKSTCPITKAPLDINRSIFLVNDSGSVVGGFSKTRFNDAVKMLENNPRTSHLRYFNPSQAV